jgi:hypothetical protein
VIPIQIIPLIHVLIVGHLYGMRLAICPLRRQQYTKIPDKAGAQQEEGGGCRVPEAQCPSGRRNSPLWRAACMTEQIRENRIARDPVEAFEYSLRIPRPKPRFASSQPKLPAVRYQSRHGIVGHQQDTVSVAAKEK